MEIKPIIERWVNILSEMYHIGLFEPFQVRTLKTDDEKDTNQTTLTCRFVKHGLQRQDDCLWLYDDEVLLNIARGYYEELTPAKFKPKEKQVYFHIDWIRKDESYVTQTEWDGCMFDQYNLAMGNCFCTAEAAKKHQKEICEKITKMADAT